jgi:S1-C subfamily serine protease
MVTKTVIVPDSMPAPEPPPAQASEPPTTTEIPQSVSGPQPGTAEIDPANAQIVTYQQAQENPQMIDPQLHTLQEFINEENPSSSLGVELREDQRKLDSGEVANGLLVVGVQAHSAAALAGLRPDKHTMRNVLQGAAIAASLFPPAAPLMFLVPVLNEVSLGETYDLIIGVDGTRVTNYLDFEDRLRDVRPGEIVYLSIVRNGQRVQVPVHIQ